MSGNQPKPGAVVQHKPAPITTLGSNPLLWPDEQWKRLENLAHRSFKSGVLPNHIKSEAAAMILILKGNELGMAPMQALERISIVNGKAAIDAQGMLSMIYERCKGARVTFKTPKEKCHLECEVEMCRPQQKPLTVVFTLEDARKADLLGKDVWKKYPRAMLRWRAISEGARLMFPDVLAGVCYTPEELGGEVDGEGKLIEKATVVTKRPPKDTNVEKAQEPTAETTPEQEPEAATEAGEKSNPEDPANYVITFGTSHKGKSLKEMGAGLVAAYAMELANHYQQEKKALPANVQSFMLKAAAFCGEEDVDFSL